MKNRKFILVCGLVFFAFALTACREKEDVTEVPASEETVSGVEENIQEEVSEEESETNTEETVENGDEGKSNNLVLEEKQAKEKIAVLVEKYPKMNEEVIYNLFCEFNTYSFTGQGIQSLRVEYNKDIYLSTIFQEHKFDYIFDTYAGDFEEEYSITFDVSDFIFNDEARAFAEEVDDYFSKIAYTEDEAAREEMNLKIKKYINGENEIFSYDFVNPNECESDLAASYYFIASYYFTFMYDKNEELSKSVKSMIRQSPMEIRYRVEREKSLIEFLESSEGKEAIEKAKEEMSIESNS